MLCHNISVIQACYQALQISASLGMCKGTTHCLWSFPAGQNWSRHGVYHVRAPAAYAAREEALGTLRQQNPLTDLYGILIWAQRSCRLHSSKDTSMAVGTQSQASAEVSAYDGGVAGEERGKFAAESQPHYCVSHIDTEAHHVCSLNLPMIASCKLGTWTTQRKTKGFRTSNLLCFVCDCSYFGVSRIVRVCDELRPAPARCAFVIVCAHPSCAHNKHNILIWVLCVMCGHLCLTYIPDVYTYFIAGTFG